MSRRLERAALAGLALLVAAVFVPSAQRDEGVAVADKSSVTLMSAQTAAGPGLASATTATTPVEGGSDRYVFQFHASGSGADVQLQQSNDGSTWAVVHSFAGLDEVWSTATCGACSFRPYKLNTGTATATVILTMSGASVALAPTYTATSTPTATRTPTVTPTHP